MSASKFAVLVGINSYRDDPLRSCVSDANELSSILATKDAAGEEFVTNTLTCEQEGRNGAVTREDLFRAIGGLLDHDPRSDLLFYFSGHGGLGRLGPEILTLEEDGTTSSVSLDQLAATANRANHASFTIVLDSCSSGAVGVHEANGSDPFGQVHLAKGVALLSATRTAESAFDGPELSPFTACLVDGLQGAAVDLLGRVTPTSLYTLAHAALTATNKPEPVLKSHSEGSAVLRHHLPRPGPAEFKLLREIFDDDTTPMPRFVNDIISDPAGGFLSPDGASIDSMIAAGLIRISISKSSTSGGSDTLHLTLTESGRHCYRVAKLLDD